MKNREYKALIRRKRAAGRRIDPATAEVWFEYAHVLDPYGTGDLAPELQQAGRVWFAADPVERERVAFDHLPDGTCEALELARRRADSEGWRAITNSLRKSKPPQSATRKGNKRKGA